MGENVDFERDRAVRPCGASGAELANIVNEAALRAVRLGRDQVSQADLEEAVETVIAGASAQERGDFSKREKRMVAYHEIGHALVAAKQIGLRAGAEDNHQCRARRARLGYTMQVESEEARAHDPRGCHEPASQVLTGGPHRGGSWYSAPCTIGRVQRHRKGHASWRAAMVTKYGHDPASSTWCRWRSLSNQYLGGESQLTCSAETAARVDAEVNDLIKSAHDKAREVLTKDRHAMDVLAGFLLERETITGRGIHGFAGQGGFGQGIKTGCYKN